MNKSCPAFLLRRVALLLLLSGTLPGLLRAQVDSTGSSKLQSSGRQNAWLSAGIGIGGRGLALMGSGWYSDNEFVVGFHAADVTQLWGPEVHDVAMLFGVRNLSPHGLMMIAAGPALLGGKLYVGDPYIPRQVPRNEIGVAVSAEAILTFQLAGVGLEPFAAVSGNRIVEGVILSLQLGWLGK